MLVLPSYAAKQRRCSVIMLITVATACRPRVFILAAKTAKAERTIGPSAENFSVRDNGRCRDRRQFDEALIRLDSAQASAHQTDIIQPPEHDGAARPRTKHKPSPINMTARALLRGIVFWGSAPSRIHYNFLIRILQKLRKPRRSDHARHQRRRREALNGQGT